MRISVNRIEPGTRLRGADPSQVAAIAASIQEVGLLCPITVFARNVVVSGVASPGWGLVAGLHRLEACKLLGFDEIEAVEVTLSELQRQIAECDENLCGTKLTQAERAMFTTRRKHAYLALHPDTAHGAIGNGREKSCQNGNSTQSFVDDTATRTRHGKRTIARDASRGERIDADVLLAVVGSGVDSGKTLDALAAVPKEQQRAELMRLQSAPASKPVPLPKNELETEDDWRGAMMRLWNRAPDDWRERFIDYVQAPVFDSTRSGAA